MKNNAARDFQQWVGMIYRGPGSFLRSSYDSAPRPPPSHPTYCQPVVSLSQSSCVSPVELIDARRGGRAKSDDGEKAWTSLNHSILSVREEERAMRKTTRNLSISGSVCIHCTVMEDEGQGVVLGWERNCVSRASLFRTVYTSLISGVHLSLIGSLHKNQPLLKTVITRTTCTVRLLHYLWREHTRTVFVFWHIFTNKKRFMIQYSTFRARKP